MSLNKPNILYVVVDCMRTDRTFGSKRSAHLPTLQTLAEEGTLFSHLITINSVTIPCMTSTFSGMYPRNHGVRSIKSARIADDIPLLAEILHDNGYHTYAEATGPLNSYYRLNRGFDHYQNRDGVAFSFLGKWGDEFIARFRNGELQEPWFVYLHLWEVHQPRQVLPVLDSPQYGLTVYDRALSSVDARLGQLLEAAGDNVITLVTGDHGEKIPENKLEVQIERVKGPFTGLVRSKSGFSKRFRNFVVHARKSWYGAIRLLHRLKLVENPLVTITGHGYHVYDSLVRVPLLIAGHHPSSPGEVISEQVSQLDIMPTILDMSGLGDKIPATIDGRTIVSLIEGKTLPTQPIFIETCQNTQLPSDFYGVRTSHWKYACHISDSNVPEELYDLEADPDETNNLAKANPEKAAEMRALLEQHLQKDLQSGVLLTEELTEQEMTGLTDRLEKLGYIE